MASQSARPIQLACLGIRVVGLAPLTNPAVLHPAVCKAEIVPFAAYDLHSGLHIAGIVKQIIKVAYLVKSGHNSLGRLIDNTLSGCYEFGMRGN